MTRPSPPGRTPPRGRSGPHVSEPLPPPVPGGDPAGASLFLGPTGAREVTRPDHFLYRAPSQRPARGALGYARLVVDVLIPTSM